MLASSPFKSYTQDAPDRVSKNTITMPTTKPMRRLQPFGLPPCNARQFWIVRFVQFVREGVDTQGRFRYSVHIDAG